MNLANHLTILRILLVPFFIASLVYYTPEKDFLRLVALGIFCLAVLTDAVDGYIARVKKLETKLGVFLDPIADKLLLVSAFICLAVVRALPESFRVPPWIPIAIISRDALIVFGCLLIHMISGSLNVRPSRLGKLTTFFQMMTVIVILLQFKYSFIVWNIAAFFTIISGIGYVVVGSRLLNASSRH